MICVVCNEEILKGQFFSHHQRLNVDIHGSCPTIDVCGEDVSMHAMMWGVA
jgi:hypothetical protein